MGKKDKRENQLDEMPEWREKRYPPWYDAPKREIIPEISDNGNPKLMAIVSTILLGVGSLGLITMIVTSFMYGNQGVEMILCITPIIGVGVWQIIIYWRKYYKHKAAMALKAENSKRKRKKYKKR